jgi:hypothetical protein
VFVHARKALDSDDHSQDVAGAVKEQFDGSGPRDSVRL